VPDAQKDVESKVNAIEDPDPPSEDETNPARTIVPADSVTYPLSVIVGVPGAVAPSLPTPASRPELPPVAVVLPVAVVPPPDAPPLTAMAPPLIEVAPPVTVRPPLEIVVLPAWAELLPPLREPP
jgi:hypothetical protein